MNFLLLSAGAILFIFCGGCKTAYSVMRAEPAPLTDFLPDNKKLKDQEADFPFRKIWIDDSVDWKKYKKIIVAPVYTEYLLKQDWWSGVNEEKIASDAKKDCCFIAKYMENSFRDSISRDTDHRFNVVSKPGTDTIILEMALTELVPTKAFFNAAEMVAGFFVPGMGLLSLLNSGSVAMEARIKDSESGKVIAMFADREKDTAAIIDIAGLKWYSHAENIIDGWSGDFVKLSNSGNLDVRAKFPFELISF